MGSQIDNLPPPRPVPVGDPVDFVQKVNTSRWAVALAQRIIAARQALGGLSESLGKITEGLDFADSLVLTPLELLGTIKYFLIKGWKKEEKIKTSKGEELARKPVGTAVIISAGEALGVFEYCAENFMDMADAIPIMGQVIKACLFVGFANRLKHKLTLKKEIDERLAVVNRVIKEGSDLNLSKEQKQRLVDYRKVLEIEKTKCLLVIVNDIKSLAIIVIFVLGIYLSKHYGIDDLLFTKPHMSVITLASTSYTFYQVYYGSSRKDYNMFNRENDYKWIKSLDELNELTDQKIISDLENSGRNIDKI